MREPLDGRVRIFLSYSREDSGVAERVRLALEESGHDVFFDREDLAPGQSFHDRIRAAIERCDVLVALTSRTSVDAGSYTLTEVEIAAQRWRRLDGRMLPVRLDDLPLVQWPAVLKSVTILEPLGDPVAETAAAVERLARRLRARKLRIAAAALAGAVVVALGAFALLSRRRAFAGVVNEHVQALAGDLRHRARFVQVDPSDDASYLIAADDPAELLDVSFDGRAQRLTSLKGAPLALAAADELIAVATDAAESLYLLAGAEREVFGPYTIEPFAPAEEIFPGTTAAAFSKRVHALAICDESAWLATQDEEALPQVNRLAFDSEGDPFWKLPYFGHYDEDSQSFSAAARDVRWCRSGQALWSVRPAEDGASFGCWWPQYGDEYPGDARTRGARDLAPAPDGSFYLVTADAALIQVRHPAFSEDDSFVRELGRFAGLDPMSANSDHRLASARQRVLIAWNEYDSGAPRSPLATRLWTWDPDAGLRELATLPQRETLSLATHPDRGCIVVRGAAGEFDCAEITY